MRRFLRITLMACGVLALLVLLAGCSQLSSAVQEAEERQDTSVRREAPVQEKDDAPNTVKESPAPDKDTGEKKDEAEPEGADQTAGADQAKVLAKNDHATAPGYYKLTDRTGAVSVQVPSEWEYVMGVDSEVGANWSNFGGERILSSVTASSDLYTWHNVGGVPGTYVVASRTPAQAYTDDELVASGPNDFSFRCQVGARRTFERAPNAGRLQVWKNCDGNAEGSTVTLAAASEPRECVVLLQVIMYSENDVEVGQRILDTFEADCGRVREGGPVQATVSASASPAASASASATPGLICDEYGCMTPKEVAQQKALAESGTEAWWPGSGIERPQPNNCSATETKADGC